MYLSKEALMHVYRQIGKFVTNNGCINGKTCVSAIATLLAADEFKKTNGRFCDDNKKDEENMFVKFFGNVVLLSDAKSKKVFFTKNFAEEVGNNKNFNIDHNFFSCQVLDSKKNGSVELWPTQNSVVSINKGVVCIADNGYDNFTSKYLQDNLDAFALLFLWLNRSTPFGDDSSMYNDFEQSLRNRYTEELCKALQLGGAEVKERFDDILKEISAGAPLASDRCCYLSKSDLLEDTFQTILYGVPGCGKSWEVKERLKDIDEYCTIRTVFHPEYTNADFVGQILPRIKENDCGGSTIEYEFVPGPFSKILRRAYLNPDETFYLVIEEINRGNAAAIFGEVFQLFDRIYDDKDESGGNIYFNGWSSYGIDNIDINAYIRNKLLLEQDRKQNKQYYKKVVVPTPENSSKKAGEKYAYYESIDIVSDAIRAKCKGKSDPQIHFSANTAIRLPPNLFVLATMNTSDQNVFTLDNAFQRRFKMQMVPNELTDKDQLCTEIGDTEVLWGRFWNWINEKIKSTEYNISKATDKCLGGWFIIGRKGESFPKKEFAEKVLKYLWDDVFKRNSAKSIFKKSTLEDLITTFEKGQKFNAFTDTFSDIDDDEKKYLTGKISKLKSGANIG